MSLVRLLLLIDDRVFCLPRQETGMLDLPTRSVANADADGSEAIRALVEEVVGDSDACTFLGAVRNIVDEPTVDYPWPTPVAHFGVWRASAGPVIDGTRVSTKDADHVLADRHWYPLLRHVLTAGV
ncbi:NUDIX hydrolase [Microbacterium sp. HD4P20]|uniref:NUDIX hydrolase n=1 Tax=Microbacterium sp. HD4P20 TaxID=2864874 RepID=UPI001C63BE21|nr:NUDIX hydrolase [Microbacterium sp. HD4P20]